MASPAGDPLRLESKLSRDDAGALLVFFRWKKRRRRCSALLAAADIDIGTGGGATTAAAAAEGRGSVVPGDPEVVEPLESTS